jgi:hypothetical protein
MAFKELLKKLDGESVPCVVLAWQENGVEKRNCRAVLVSDKSLILEYECKDALDCSSWKRSDCLDPSPNDWRYIAIMRMYLLEKANKEYLSARAVNPIYCVPDSGAITNSVVASLFAAVNARLGVSVPAGDSVELLLQSLSVRTDNLVRAYPRDIEASIKDKCILVASTLVSLWNKLGVCSL